MMKPHVFGEGNVFTSGSFVLFKGIYLQNIIKQRDEGRVKTPL